MKNIVIVDPAKRQLKGNIHMHTTRSDGQLPYALAAENYRKAGYDFIMMSDHEIYWDSTELDKPDFLVLGGTETAILMNPDYNWIVDYRTKANPNPRAAHRHMHYCCIKDESIEDVGQYYHHNEPVPRMLDRGIDSWNQQVRHMRERGNLVVVNHPHWSRLSPELLLATQDILAFEVWNSGDVVHCGGHPDEDIWDYCLTRGKHLYAVAGDDSHAQTTDFAAGFTVVQTDGFSKADICRGLKAGAFYASCGPRVKQMRIEDGKLYMRFTPVREVRICGYDRDGFNFVPENGKETMEELVWEINTTMRYFRPELIDTAGRKAWLQPVFVEELM